MAASINNTSLNAIVATFVVAYKARNNAVTALRDSLNKAGIELDRASLKQPLMMSVAQAYGVTMLQKARGDGVTWNMDEKESVNAKRCYATLIADLFKGAEDHKVELDVPADILKAAKALVALCAEYKDAGKLRATAIALAMQK